VGEFFLELLKGCVTFLVKVSGSTFPGEPGQRDDNVRVSKDELSVKVAKA
jgi:hypothetical protein